MCGGVDPASAKSSCGACSEILSRAVLIFGFTTHYRLAAMDHAAFLSALRANVAVNALDFSRVAVVCLPKTLSVMEG